MLELIGGPICRVGLLLCDARALGGAPFPMMKKKGKKSSTGDASPATPPKDGDPPPSQRGGQVSERGGKKKKSPPKKKKPSARAVGSASEGEEPASPDTVEPIIEEEEAAAEEVDALAAYQAATRAASAAIAKEQEAKATKEQEDEKRRQSLAVAHNLSDNAPYPVGARVNLKAQIGADQLAYVVEYDQMNAVYKVAVGEPNSADQPIVSADAVKPATSAYAKGARVGVVRSSGDVSVAFVSGFVKGLYEVALGHPDSENAKMVREVDLRPATSGYPDGERVLVTRSSGLETTAYVVAFDSAKGLYKLALGSPESEEIKVAREKDIRKEALPIASPRADPTLAPAKDLLAPAPDPAEVAKAALAMAHVGADAVDRLSAVVVDDPAPTAAPTTAAVVAEAPVAAKPEPPPAKPAIMVKKASLGDVYGSNVETHREAAETKAAAPVATEAVATIHEDEAIADDPEPPPPPPPESEPEPEKAVVVEAPAAVTVEEAVVEPEPPAKAVVEPALAPSPAGEVQMV